MWLQGGRPQGAWATPPAGQHQAQHLPPARGQRLHRAAQARVVMLIVVLGAAVYGPAHATSPLRSEDPKGHAAARSGLVHTQKGCPLEILNPLCLVPTGGFHPIQSNPTLSNKT